jgi:exonuclease III
MLSQIILPNPGELYSDACMRVLQNYISANGEKEELEKKPEFKEAVRHYLSWQDKTQRRIIFGGELAKRLNEELDKGLWERVKY